MRPMKILKIVLINAFAVIVLFVLLESACRLQIIPQLDSFKAQDNVQARMTGRKLDKQSLIAEFSRNIFDMPPVSSQSNYDISKLKNYSYADIDQTPVPDRQWVYAPDGLSRSSRYLRKIKNSTDVLFDVTYRFNKQDKRFVENQDQKKNTDMFVLAAGDSFTFGEGVTQGQDFPSVLASKLPERWRVYNYGVSGDSANDFLIRTEYDPDYFAPIKETSGVFVWTYLDIQMQRLIYPTSAYKFSYIASKPEYTLQGDEISFHGFFKESKRDLRPVIDWMAKLALTKTFNLEIPKVYTEENYKLFFKLLNAALVRMENSGHKFTKKIIVTYSAHHDFDLLSKTAIANGFIVMDIEKVLFMRDQHYGGNLNLSIPVDTHPSPEAYWLLGTALATDIPK